LIEFVLVWFLGSVNSHCWNSVSRQHAQLDVASDSSASTFFGRHFRANPKPHRPSSVVDDSVIEEPLSHPFPVRDVAKKISNIFISESETDVSSTRVDVRSFLSRSQQSRKIDASTSWSEDSGILLSGLRTLPLIPTFSESASQTADLLEGWSWYPFRAEMLQYPADLKQNSSVKVHVCAVVDPKYLFLIRDEDGNYGSFFLRFLGRLAFFPRWKGIPLNNFQLQH
jgi:hypothetical protein